MMGGYLFFSSSDNSDPRTNGMEYEIKWPHPIPPILQWVSYLASFVGIIVVLCSIAYTKKLGLVLLLPITNIFSIIRKPLAIGLDNLRGFYAIFKRISLSDS